MMTFTDLLISFNPYFYMDSSTDKESMAPIITFKSKFDDKEYSFLIPSIDMMDYSYGRKSSKIDRMIVELKSIIRDQKIDTIL